MAELPDIEITPENAYEIADYLYTHYGTQAPTADELMEADRKKQDKMVRQVGGKGMFEVFKALGMIQKHEEAQDAAAAAPGNPAQAGADAVREQRGSLADLLRQQ